MSQSYDVIILGAGGAGLMCAGIAGQRGKRMAVLDHAKKPGEKIRISGGGRCNFTNVHAGPDRFLSGNPHFCRNALSAYTPRDFITLVDSYAIAHHEKTLGQLFCDGSSQQIIDMLLAECGKGSVDIHLQTNVGLITHEQDQFLVETSLGPFSAPKLVVATGGKSIPKMGATGLGLALAEQFDLDIAPTRAGLVPFTLAPPLKERYAALSGLSLDAVVSAGGQAFHEALLFTHRGLSGPAALQASSYWHEGEDVVIDLAPGHDIYAALVAEREARPKAELSVALTPFLPKRLARELTHHFDGRSRLADQSNKTLKEISASVHQWRFVPAGTEGYRTAEVMVGGVSTAELEPKTLEVRKHPGLYFIGEVVDVTGWLGGYNFQWAWASAAAAARSL